LKSVELFMEMKLYFLFLFGIYFYLRNVTFYLESGSIL